MKLINLQICLFFLAIFTLCQFLHGQELILPAIEQGTPAPGKRVRVTTPEYQGKEVYHSLFLPADWQKTSTQKIPVIVELTGNKFLQAGSTGKVDDAGLGYGISQGKMIWVVMPYIAANHQQNELTWWGDPEATVDYIKLNLPRIIADYNGDAERLLLCGFSRGAIGVNYIGLYDDDIAKFWRGFITHDHYDGVQEWKKTAWGTPLEKYQQAALVRLKRLQKRPVLVMQNPDTANIQQFLKPNIEQGSFTFLDVKMQEIFSEYPNKYAIHPHNDRWLLVPSKYRTQVEQWVQQVLK